MFSALAIPCLLLIGASSYAMFEVWSEELFTVREKFWHTVGFACVIAVAAWLLSTNS